MFGYRADGRRLKKMDPIIRITPYLMPMRCDAQVFLQSKLDYEKMSRYIVSKSREGQKITFMQIIVAAYVRTVSRHPEVNRYIFNKQYYARNNCSVSYVVLKDPQNPESSEATVRVQFDPSDTLFDVRDRMDHAVEVSRATEDGDFVIRLARIVLGIPGLTTLVVNAYRLLDRYGLAPGFIMRELPFYSGLFITNNGSIGLPTPLHHIYNFGNVSQFIGMGTVTKCAAGCRWDWPRTNASAQEHIIPISCRTCCILSPIRRNWRFRRRKSCTKRAWSTTNRRSAKSRNKIRLFFVL